MPIRFETYRFIDGQTPLSADTFNSRFKDLDLRTASLEELKVAWEEVSDMLAREGLRKLNEVLIPIYSDMSAKQAEAIQVRDDLAALILEEQTTYAERLAELLQQAVDMLEAVPYAGHEANITAWERFI